MKCALQPTGVSLTELRRQILEFREAMTARTCQAQNQKKGTRRQTERKRRERGRGRGLTRFRKLHQVPPQSSAECQSITHVKESYQETRGATVPGAQTELGIICIPPSGMQRACNIQGNRMSPQRCSTLALGLNQTHSKGCSGLTLTEVKSKA